MSQSESHLKVLVKGAEELARRIINRNFKGQVTSDNFIQLQEVAVEIAFFACHIGVKHFKFDKQRLINYLTEGINLRFQVLEEEQGEENGEHKTPLDS